MLCVRGTSCLFTLSASEFIEPSLCHLDFFLDIFFKSFPRGYPVSPRNNGLAIL